MTDGGPYQASGEPRWQDFSLPTVLSVDARTPEEADRLITELLEVVNGVLEPHDAILQRAGDEQPQPA